MSNEGIVGAPPQVELWQPSQPALDQPDPAPLLALAAPSEDGQTTAPAGAPALPATPRPRILLALRQAVAAPRRGHRRRRHPDGPARATRLGPHRRAGPSASCPSRGGGGGGRLCSRGSWPGWATLGGCVVAERRAAQAAAGAKQPVYEPAEQGDRDRQRHQRHQGCDGLHADHPRFRLLGRCLQVCPPVLPAWPGWTVAPLRAGRGSASPLRCRLGTLHPAGPADLLADRRIAARPLQGQGRSVPPSGPVLPPLRDALRAPLTPPRPARSAIQRRPRWARTSRPASSKGR